MAGLLDDAQLGRLRAGFDEAALSEMATRLVVADFPPAAALTRGIQAVLFAADRPLTTSDAERERILIALLASQGLDRQLAVHVYWGLGAGLSPREIVEAVIIAGVYAGQGRQNAGLGVVKRALTALAEVAGTRRRKPVPYGEALAGLLLAFPA